MLFDAPEMPRKPSFLSRIPWKYHYFHEMNGHLELVGQLALNRSGHSDMLGLSTARDLFISAIISDMFLVERVVKITNVEGNIAFFGPRRSEQPNDAVFYVHVSSPSRMRARTWNFRSFTLPGRARERAPQGG